MSEKSKEKDVIIEFEDEEKPTIEKPIEHGIGLSIEDVQALLAKENQTIVASDDPFLLMVTIMNACLTEQEKLHRKHCNALTQLLNQRTDSYVKAMQDAVGNLTQALSKASEESIKNRFDAHEVKMEKLKTTLWLCGTVNLLTVSLIIIALVFLK